MQKKHRHMIETETDKKTNDRDIWLKQMTETDDWDSRQQTETADRNSRQRQQIETADWDRHYNVN